MKATRRTSPSAEDRTSRTMSLVSRFAVDVGAGDCFASLCHRSLLRRAGAVAADSTRRRPPVTGTGLPAARSARSRVASWAKFRIGPGDDPEHHGEGDAQADGHRRSAAGTGHRAGRASTSVDGGASVRTGRLATASTAVVRPAATGCAVGGGRRSSAGGRASTRVATVSPTGENMRTARRR